MITLKDLQNRVYSGKECIRFEVEVAINREHKILATFKRKIYPDRMDVPNEWTMQVILNRTRDKDSEVYNFGYIMPRNGLALELIAATGLRYFQLYLKEEIQMKTNLDFTIGEIIRGM